MEFKNFENKLIIEKITNYCIENNISTQKINALTAKIKFGKLNEADSWTDWAGEKIGTGAGRYRKSIRVVQDNLQKAIDYLKAVDADLGPGADNIFTKNKVSLDGAKKNALQNAVSQLKTAIDQYSPIVKNSLQAIGGQITGASNYGDEQSFDFDAMFPELKTGGTLEAAFKTAYTTGGTPFSSDKQADLSRILLTSRQNILKTFKVLDASKHGEFIQKIKAKVAEAITKFGTPATVDAGYALLNTIVGGNNTPTSNPTKPILTDRTINTLIKNQGSLHDVYKNELVNATNLPEIKTIFEKIWDGTNISKISALLTQAINKVPKSAASVTATTTADADVVKDLMDNFESLFY